MSQIDVITKNLSYGKILGDDQLHDGIKESENLNYDDANLLEVSKNPSYQVASIHTTENPSYDSLKTDTTYDYITVSTSTTATPESIYY